MRKIAIVSEYFYPHLGGITEHVYHFSKELIARGFDVTLITGGDQTPSDVELPTGLTVLRLGRSVPIYNNHSFGRVTIGLKLGKKVQDILKHECFDLIHIHSPVMPTLPLLFQKYSNAVTVGTFHTYFDTFTSFAYYRVFQKYAQAYLDKLDGVIAVSQSCIDSMDKLFCAKYRIIPNGVDVNWMSSPGGTIRRYDDGHLNVLFLGRLDPRNGLDDLLKAFPQVLACVPNARLIVVGDGPDRFYYEKQAGDLLGKKIFFEGQINGSRPEYFATSHVFCYPATKASFGITLLEAMAAGRPVVATKNRGFQDIIADEVDGLLVKPQNPTALAQSLIRVLQDKVLAVRLAKNARQKVERYSWGNVTDQVLAFYNQVYQRKQGIPFAA